jgi:hypothetical protein
VHTNPESCNPKQEIKPSRLVFFGAVCTFPFFYRDREFSGPCARICGYSSGPAADSSVFLQRSIPTPQTKREVDDDSDADDDRDEREPKRTRSRILCELRPVASPQGGRTRTSPASRMGTWP